MTCVSRASAGRVFEWGGEREHWQGLLEQRSAGVPGDVEPSCRRGQRQISRLPALLGKVPRGIHWVSTSTFMFQGGTGRASQADHPVDAELEPERTLFCDEPEAVHLHDGKHYVAKGHVGLQPTELSA